MSSFLLILPSDFADHEWEVTAKGWFSEAWIKVDGRSYQLNFYDPVRLGQEVISKLEYANVFFEPNLLVVESVTKAEMERAVEQLVQSGLLSSLTPSLDHPDE